MDTLEGQFRENNKNTGSILMKLLEDNPNPPLFCVHRVTSGSSHVCMTPPPNNVTPPLIPNIMPAPCTPLPLRKVTSLLGLELDSDTSSAGWSLSMATPLNPSVTVGKPLLVNSLLSTTAPNPNTDTEDEDEGHKSLLCESKKLSRRVLINKDTPVVRTLFPRPSSRNVPLAPSSDDEHSPVLTSATSPSAMATISLVQTPHNDSDKDSVCSQELFESPAIVNTPNNFTCVSHELDQDSSESLPATPTRFSQPLVHSTPNLPPLKQVGATLSPPSLCSGVGSDCDEAVLPLMTPLVTTPTLGDEDVFDVLFLSLSQLESRLGTRSNCEQYSSVSTSSQQVNTSKERVTPVIRTVDAHTPELKQPMAKRKKLNTKIFSYPNNQQVKESKCQIKRSKPNINSLPLESLSPPFKKAKFENVSEANNKEYLSLSELSSSQTTCEQPVNTVILSVDESILTAENTECLSYDNQSETEGQVVIKASSQVEQKVQTVREKDCLVEVVNQPPLPPIDSISAVLETPPKRDPSHPTVHSSPLFSQQSAFLTLLTKHPHEANASSSTDELSLLSANLSLNNSSFTGFKTASGGSIAISAEALDKAKQFFSEGNDCKRRTADSENTLITNIKTISKTVAPSAFVTPSLHKESFVSSNITRSTLSSLRPARSRSKSFKAPRLAASVSKTEEKASLSRILEKFEIKATFNSITPRSAKEQRTATETAMKTQQRQERPKTKTSVTGFSTAAGMQLCVSSESLENAKRLSSDDTHSSLSDKTDQITSVGFQTASGKGISVSSKALTRAKSILKDSEMDICGETVLTTSTTTGFKTASGSTISVCNKSLQKVKQLFVEDADSALDVNDCCTDHTSCLSVKDIEHMNYFIQIQQNDQSSTTQPNDDPQQPSEYLSDSDNDPPHPDKARNTGDDVLSAVDDDCFFNTQVVKQFLYLSEDEENCQTVDSSQKNLRPCRLTPSPGSNSSDAILLPETPDNGLRLITSTYSGSDCDPSSPLSIGVRLSELEATFSSDIPSKLEASSLSAMKDVLTQSMVDNILDSSLTDGKDALDNEESTPTVLICRAPLSPPPESGNIVDPNVLVQDSQKRIAIDLDTTESSVVIGEFVGEDRTEGKDAVSIPDTPPQDTTLIKTGFTGFRTAAGKKVDVSKQALAAVRLKFSEFDKQNDCFNQLTVTSDPLRNEVQKKLFPGLQTASGKKVEVSEQSLQAVRETLHIEAQEVKQWPLRLQTASSKEVKISEQSFQAANTALQSTLTPSLPSTSVHRGVSSQDSHTFAELFQATTRDNDHSNKTAGSLTTSVLSTFQPLLRNVKSIGQPSTETTQTTVKYKPIFTTGVAKKPTVFGQPQRRLGLSKRVGVISTPESSLQDRHPSRSNKSLLPAQTYLNETGSYSVSSQQFYNTPSRTQHLSTHQPCSNNSVQVNNVPPLYSGRLKRSQPVWKGKLRAKKLQNISKTDTYVKPKPAISYQEKPVDAVSVTVSGSSLDPMHITLSQVFALEQSQQQRLLDNESKPTSKGTKKEDSGYVSREVSSARSPTPETQSLAKDGLRNVGVLTTYVVNNSLNDSLETNATLLEPVEQSVTPPTIDTPIIHTTSSSPMPGTILVTRSECPQRISLQSLTHGIPPGRHSVKELLSLGVHIHTISVSFGNARDYRFEGSWFFSSAVLRGSTVYVGDGMQLIVNQGMVGLNECWESFRQSPGVEERLISFEWFSNHWEQLVWKLAAMEVSYPRLFARRCLTPDWLLLQFKYRYDREIDGAQRCALRKICEQDDLASRRIVLCVASIDYEKIESSLSETGHGVESGNVTVQADVPCIRLTDGWYTLPTIIDPPLKHMIKNKKISVGTKLVIFGAELMGLSSPCHPLEVPQSCSLKISTNSTRRARWYAKLGYQMTPHPYPLPLTALYPDGGLVGATDIVIARVYPLLFFEKKEGARGVFRSEKQERKIAASFEKKRQSKIEDICSRVQREFEDEEAKKDCGAGRRRSRRLNTLQIRQLQDGEEIHAALNNATDPSALQELLTHTQRVLLESYHQSLVEKRQNKLNERIKEAIQEADYQLPRQRLVTPFLKMKVLPCGGRECVECMLSVWRPAEGLDNLLKEGSAVRVTNLTTPPTKSHFHNLQLTATRSTIYQPLTSPNSQTLCWYTPRKCYSISSLREESRLAGDDIDVVGVVACITSNHVMSHDLEEQTERQLDNVFLANGEKGLLLIKVWDGLEVHCLGDIVHPGALLSVTNLTYRGIDHTHNIPTATMKEVTLFSQRPTNQYLVTALDQLRTSLPEDIGDYLDMLQIPLDF